MARRLTTRRPTAFLLAGFATLALAFAPAIAEARPGGGSSSGNRGSRTYSAPPPTTTAPGTTRQFDRTETTRPAQTQPGAAAPTPARPGTTAPAGGFFSRNPLMAGLMGGLLGAGLFGLLSGAGLFGGMAGFASFIGLLLQVALIAGLVFLVMRLIRGRRPAMASGPAAAMSPGMARDMQGSPRIGVGPMGGAMGSNAVPATRPIEVTGEDYQAFERALVEVNAAWSRQDLEALRRISTPEMTNYFAQDLSDLRARGWTNATQDVRLEGGDLSEAWNEDGQDFATVAMRFSLVDVTTDATGRVVEGHPTERQTVTEMWTFVRRGMGTTWQLSAIQQTG